MKKLVVAILWCLAVSATRAAAVAPGPWKPVSLPAAAADVDLRSICFVDDRHGWIVGDRGLCLATTDGGRTWEKRDTGSDATLRCVRFTDARNGFACGDGDSRAAAARGHVVMGRPQKQGTLLSTTDGGATWKPAWVPCNFEIWCVEAATAPKIQVGIGVDDHLDGDITRSADGGATWTERRVFRALADIRALNATRWVAVGSPVSVGFLGADGIKDPAFVARECRALYSDDAGETWKVSKGSDGAAVLRGLLARPGLPVVAIGDGGALLVSDDAGENWRAVPAPARVRWRGIAADAAAERPAVIVAVGDRGGFLLSTDAGRTWRVSSTGAPGPLHAVAACGSRFLAVGAGGAALECTAEALAAARDLPPLPSPPIAKAGPVPKATAEQRALVRVGDFTLTTHALRGPKLLGLDLEWQVKQTITAVAEDTCTMVTEVVKGQPPAGLGGAEPVEREVPIAALFGAENRPHVGMQVGETRELPDGPDVTVKMTREANEIVEVKGVKLDCVVVTTVAVEAKGGTSASKEWHCPARIPIQGLVKAEHTLPLQLPGGLAAAMKSTQTLTEWKRAGD
jgi:photosystem II stability/assembly factor-like uncharacterized protein